MAIARSLRPDARLLHLAERLHDLGAGPLAHFLSDIEAGHDVRSRLERYASLPADLVHAYGGDRIERRPMVLAGGRR